MAATEIDFYGRFLTEDEIRFVPDEAKRPVQLTLGDFALQVGKAEPVCLPDHQRFILNALLREPDGALLNEDLIELGFQPEAANTNVRAVTIANSKRALMETLNDSKREVITKKKEDGFVVLRFIPTLKVRRLSTELDVSRHPDVAERVAAMAEKHAKPDPLVHLGISQEVAVGLRGYIFDGGRMPAIPAEYAVLHEYRRALKMLAGKAEKGSPADDRFREVSAHVADLGADERRARPPSQGRYWKSGRSLPAASQ